jgi:DNA-directed RNA polymerase specialized sigma24 family protein
VGILDLAASQRRAFVLRDVLRFPAAEGATLMGTSEGCPLSSAAEGQFD